jgi:hypothetical protein
MLAPSYKSADELGISEQQKQALISTMYALQRQEFTQFGMGGWGTCICGQAHKIDTEVKGLMVNTNLHPLFIPCPATMCERHRTYDTITQAEAARAVRNFLVTGHPHWGDALERYEKPSPLAILQSVDGLELNRAEGWVEMPSHEMETV